MVDWLIEMTWSLSLSISKQCILLQEEIDILVKKIIIPCTSFHRWRTLGLRLDCWRIVTYIITSGNTHYLLCYFFCFDSRVGLVARKGSQISLIFLTLRYCFLVIILTVIVQQYCASWVKKVIMCMFVCNRAVLHHDIAMWSLLSRKNQRQMKNLLALMK